MGFAFGFGSIEEGERQKVKDALWDGTLAGKDATAILKEWNDKAAENDAMPRDKAPERYTSVRYYDNTLHFSHINRQHPFSPDGWAMLSIEERFALPQQEVRS